MGKQWIFVVFGACCLSLAFLPSGRKAPKPKVGGTWASSNKQFFGTAFEGYDKDVHYSRNSPTSPISRVWFTGAQGVMTELYWPKLDNAQSRDTQFLVTEGDRYFFEERRDSTTEVKWLETGVPAFYIVNKEKHGKFVIERWVQTDPDRDVVLQHFRITRNVPRLRFYLHHNPSAANSPMGDTAFASKGNAPGAGLFAFHGNEAQALVSSRTWKNVAAGFEGTSSDGYVDLQDGQLDTSAEWAKDSNVVLTGEVDLPEGLAPVEFDVAIGFGESMEKAQANAKESLAHSFFDTLATYKNQWQTYQSSIKDLASNSGDNGELFRSSVALIKSMEDKTHEGAFIASPSIPWGEYQIDAHPGPGMGKPQKESMGGYHLVWPRDLYHMATSFLAIEDGASAIASLNYLRAVQLDGKGDDWCFGKHCAPRDGSFFQNTWLDGTQHWIGVQSDEVGYPILLAFRLWKQGYIGWKPYWNMVKRAANFLVEFGPWTYQERWEDAFGVSPNTVAIELSALWAAAEIAEAAGDLVSAKKFKETADRWCGEEGNNVEAWTFTNTGNLGNGRYYVRIEGAKDYNQEIDPNDEVVYELANGAGKTLEKDVTDGGFLELVRIGVRRALDPHIVETIPEYDDTLRVELPGLGFSYRRYFGDLYNYDESTGKQTQGMPWPILSGERGHYDLAVSEEKGESLETRRSIAKKTITVLEKFASKSYMIPEQVWDRGEKMGLSTGSATPLGWAHGEYIKLLRSRHDGSVFDRIPAIAGNRRRVLGE